MKRVLHVIGRMDLGGAETMVMNIYRNIDRTRTQFDFVVHRSEPGEYEREIAKLGGRVFRVPSPASAGLLEYRKAFREVLREHGPFAAVHSHVHAFSGYVVFVAAFEGVRVRIVHAHTSRDLPNESPLRRAYVGVMKLLIRIFATDLFGCSEDACQFLYGRDRVASHRASIVRNGVNWTEFASPAKDRHQTRRELGLGADVPIFCHVGNFVPAKNHRFLVAVFKDIVQGLPNSHLLLVGDGGLREVTQSSVRALGIEGSVSFLGHRRDIPSILNASDLFLFPSIYEGVPVALVEAQAAGLPCLVSERISSEADLGAGLMSVLSLDTAATKWATRAIDLLSAPVRVDLSRRVHALKTSGYDASQVAESLESIYGA